MTRRVTADGSLWYAVYVNLLICVLGAAKTRSASVGALFRLNTTASAGGRERDLYNWRRMSSTTATDQPNASRKLYVVCVPDRTDPGTPERRNALLEAHMKYARPLLDSGFISKSLLKDVAVVW